ncbi:MAG TPA: 3-dehydroquinate synthase [Pyrinomonadaceae bacterium]
MKRTIIPVRLRTRGSAYDVAIGSKTLRGTGAALSRLVGTSPTKVLIVSNRKVYGLYGNVVSESLGKEGFRATVHLIGDGERFKSFGSLERTLRVLSEGGFTRTDPVIALGGGVVGDLAGFAASVYLRGVPLLQIPTTFLAMIDSSVGGKTAVNTEFGKNLIGTFYQPKGVLIDIDVLKTLPARELTGGFCEAIKQGAVSGKPLFELTAAFLETYPSNRFHRYFDEQSFLDSLTGLIGENVRFKARIVQNDEIESVRDNSARSRKILNFGHTVGHALEKLTDYKKLRHGEAVGYGIRFAAQLSKKLEFISQNEVDSLNDVVHRAGVLPALSNIDPSDLIETFKADKKRVGNSLHWILLRGIGKPVIVRDDDIPRSAIKSTLKSIIQN